MNIPDKHRMRSLEDRVETLEFSVEKLLQLLEKSADCILKLNKQVHENSCKGLEGTH